MTKREIKTTLKKHKKWLNNEEGGKRANLRGEKLYNAKLEKADLRHTDLQQADLWWANLQDADLRRANLSGADLSGADLYGADLRRANLENAYMRGSSLQNANLSGANLRNADLVGVDLQGADLENADLRGAKLDYSCLPLWCGSLTANFDDRQLKQIAYHLVKAGLQSKNASEKTKAELAKLIDFANEFHRVKECGLIEKEKTDDH